MPRQEGRSWEGMQNEDVVTLPPWKQEGQKSRGLDFGVRRIESTTCIGDAPSS